MRATQSFGDMLQRLGQAVAETRSMAQTIVLADAPPPRWPEEFRKRYLDLMDRAGEEIAGGDAEGLRAIRNDLGAFAGGLSLDDLPDGFWPVGGALLVNLRNILEALEVIVDARPVEVPPPGWSAKLRHPLSQRRRVSAH
jgi:hypothetical protein